MEFNDREALVWALASFCSFVAWLSAAQVTLLGEQLGGKLHIRHDEPVHAKMSGTSATPTTTLKPGQPSSFANRKPGAPGQLSRSRPRRGIGTSHRHALAESQRGRQARRRLPSPLPISRHPRTSLGVPLWVPNELNWGNQGRPEWRRSWPPVARMPWVLRPSGGKKSL